MDEPDRAAPAARLEPAPGPNPAPGPIDWPLTLALWAIMACCLGVWAVLIPLVTTVFFYP